MIRAMNGIDATTGKRLSGLDHLRQSVRDILTTPIGTRVMRRAYGSRLYQLVDAPINGPTLLDLFTATAEALATWEPRIEVENVSADRAEPGRVVLSLIGTYLPDGQQITIDGIEVS
jgi:phage baseplate assembly protein W